VPHDILKKEEIQECVIKGKNYGYDFWVGKGDLFAWGDKNEV
jgi:hypothetical protein